MLGGTSALSHLSIGKSRLTTSHVGARWARNADVMISMFTSHVIRSALMAIVYLHPHTCSRPSVYMSALAIV